MKNTLDEFTKQVRLAREVLEAKGAPIEGTAAGHLILALELVVADRERAEADTARVMNGFARGLNGTSSRNLNNSK